MRFDLRVQLVVAEQQVDVVGQIGILEVGGEFGDGRAGEGAAFEGEVDVGAAAERAHRAGAEERDVLDVRVAGDGVADDGAVGVGQAVGAETRFSGRRGVHWIRFPYRS